MEIKILEDEMIFIKAVVTLIEVVGILVEVVEILVEVAVILIEAAAAETMQIMKKICILLGLPKEINKRLSYQPRLFQTRKSNLTISIIVVQVHQKPNPSLMMKVQRKICILHGQPKKVLNKEFNNFRGKKLFLEM